VREVCAVILAAGEGTRLRPLTDLVPKALCPVGNIPLLDLALMRTNRLGLTGPAQVAVNACHLADQIVSHVDGRAHVSVEEPPPLGTAGGVARLRDWIDGRGVLVGNADAYLIGSPPDALLAGWDGENVRLLGVPTSPTDPFRFGAHRFAGYSLLPWSVVKDLPTGRAELVHLAWRPAEAAGRLTVVPHPGTYVDTGTPADYLAANLRATMGGNLIGPGASVTGRLDRAVVGAGAEVRGRVTRGVVWPGGFVGADEHLVDAIRVGADLTVPAGR